MGVGGQGPQDIEIWHFPIKCFARKVVFFVSSGGNKILPLLASLQIYFWPTPGHTCRSRQIFGHAKDFCPKSSNLPEKFCVTFANKFSPIKNPFLVWPPKKGFMCFFANVGHHFLKSNNVGCHFCPDCQGFCPDFNKSKYLGCAFPLHPHLLHPCPWKIHFWPLTEKNPSGAHV